jgi:uncharacterized membrane protein HdeD (DUF308 family)
MPDDTLPIVFRGSVRNTLFVLAAGAAMLVAGIYALHEPMSQMVGGRRSIALVRIDGSTMFVGGLASAEQARDAIVHMAEGMKAA